MNLEQATYCLQTRMCNSSATCESCPKYTGLEEDHEKCYQEALSMVVSELEQIISSGRLLNSMLSSMESSEKYDKYIHDALAECNPI